MISISKNCHCRLCLGLNYHSVSGQNRIKPILALSEDGECASAISVALPSGFCVESDVIKSSKSIMLHRSRHDIRLCGVTPAFLYLL